MISETMRKFDLGALEIFREIAREGSVTGAAASLNRVQSNVSTRLKQLEERLEATLFVRGRRGLALTEDGRTLLNYAERLLALSEEAADALVSGAPSGAFRIGTMESTAASRLPEILSRYHADHPDVDIHVETDTAGGLTEKLVAGRIDVAFVAEPLDIANVRTEPVFEERLMLVAPAGFPELKKIDEISGRTIVAFREGCAYRRYLNDWLLDEGIVPGGILSLGSYLAILACVSAGTGYAVVPKSVLDMIATRGDFHCHDLPERYSRIRTLLAWRESYKSPKLDALRALMPPCTQQSKRVGRL